MLEDQLNQDIKQAMLAGDAPRVTALRGIKATILNLKVAQGSRGENLPDEALQELLLKQAKQRQESADLFWQGGNEVSAEKELYEKALIESYLPTPMTEDELSALVEEAVAHTEAEGAAGIGKVIAYVKDKAGVAADNALVARLAKERLTQ